MARLDVDAALSCGLVYEVGPLVQAMIGWPLGLDTLRIRVVPKDRGYEEVVLGRLQGAGIDTAAASGRGMAERLLEYVVEGAVLSAYEPSTGELLVVRENVDESNLNGLRLVVAHELVHRGQHLRHPCLFDRVNGIIRRLFRHASEGEVSLQQVRTAVAEVSPIMTLLESHAYYVQECLHRLHFPDAIVESHFDLPGLLFRVLGGFKLSQYTQAIPQVAEATQNGTVDALYASVWGLEPHVE